MSSPQHEPEPESDVEKSRREAKENIAKLRKDTEYRLGQLKYGITYLYNGITSHPYCATWCAANTVLFLSGFPPLGRALNYKFKHSSFLRDYLRKHALKEEMTRHFQIRPKPTHIDLIPDPLARRRIKEAFETWKRVLGTGSAFTYIDLWAIYERPWLQSQIMGNFEPKIDNIARDLQKLEEAWQRAKTGSQAKKELPPINERQKAILKLQGGKGAFGAWWKLQNGELFWYKKY